MSDHNPGLRPWRDIARRTSRQIMVGNVPVGGGVHLDILVRRCFYLDEVSGERYAGVASNYLCDAKPGDQITAFALPADSR